MRSTSTNSSNPGLVARMVSFLRVMRRKKRPMQTLQLLRKRPALLLSVNAFEMAHLVSARVPFTVKALAEVKTSALVGCPF